MDFFEVRQPEKPVWWVIKIYTEVNKQILDSIKDTVMV